MNALTVPATAATVAAVADGLPSYVIVRVTGRLGADRAEQTWDLMARDYPRPERRFTNLTTGSEVFDIAGFLANVNATVVEIAHENVADAVITFEVTP